MSNKATVTTVVLQCEGCPFSHDDRPHGPMVCLQVADMQNGWGGRRRVPREADEPPRWCPLRRADHLVTLRTKETQ